MDIKFKKKELIVDEKSEEKPFGRPKGSYKTLEGELEKLVDPAFRYLKDVVLGLEERPNAVRLNACRGIVILAVGRRKEDRKRKALPTKQEILGKAGTEYDDLIRTGGNDLFNTEGQQDI